MNCREFEDIVNDLARAKMIDAQSRVAGMAHAEICERCASRLDNERSLSDGLKILAENDEGKAAPDRVEVALLKAFRSEAPNQVAKRLPVQSISWSRWVLAAAAAILIAFGMVIYSAIQNEPQNNSDVVKEKAPGPQPSVDRKQQIVKENDANKTRRISRSSRPRRNNRLQLKIPFVRYSLTTYAKDNEYTTDFFALSYSENQKTLESDEVNRVQVIRVEMPRPALIAFGLPVNLERGDEPVKADLLVGEDGQARAIRFVR